MTAGKKLKSKLKQKSDVDDKAKIIENIEEPFDNTKNKKKVSKRNKSRLECTQVGNPYTTDECQKVGEGVNKKEKLKCASKEVHFAFLPEKYEPLLEEDENKETIKEEKRNKNHQKYKKYRKNAVKVLRFGWRCLVVGLQEFAAGYTASLYEVATVVPDRH
ncbi:hypothetical protein AOXY_G6273 [Acipenser oxyrinchus oxyrinchus]|uniref:Uncharacterized protein n=1 Tax=Acipenser oxyrinchus oxyrinchus TaxID=40147 RepID=A0AAD8GBR3_ACIOX|nr:hypothetical protein AOXY_G6273 [Acipenser oxyrinchus oxyrinchus]